MKLRVNGDINDFPRVTVSKWGRGLYPGSSASHKCTRPIIPPEEIQENRQPSGPRWRKAGYPRVLLSPGDILLVKVKVDITSDVIFCYFPFIGYDDKDVCLLWPQHNHCNTQEKPKQRHKPTQHVTSTQLWQGIPIILSLRAQGQEDPGFSDSLFSFIQFWWTRHRAETEQQKEDKDRNVLLINPEAWGAGQGQGRESTDSREMEMKE